MVHFHHPQSKTHDFLHDYRHMQKGRVAVTLAITLVVMLIEVFGGLLTNSMALISDAGHMFTHAFALAISYAAMICMSIEACHHRTYGFYRAEVLAALFNSLFLFAVSGLIIGESIHRMISPKEVLTQQMLLIALIGLAVNVMSIWILKVEHSQHDRNMRGVILHLLADTGSSVAVVIGAVVMAYTGWHVLDPILSIGIAVIILFWAWGLLKDSVNVLLETAPAGIKTDELSRTLEKEIPGIIKVEDIHVWEITTNMYSMTAHMVLENILLSESAKIREQIDQLLYDRYNIGHTTIQFRSK